MQKFCALVLIASTFFATACFAKRDCDPNCPRPENQYSMPCPDCCEGLGGVSYCDSSAGRFVCNNGSYSACYCDRHAVMDLQKIEGCCLWKGGVLAIDHTGLVVCNDGGVSETCTLENIISHSDNHL